MISIYTLESSSDAAKYYQQGDYYTQGGAGEHSLWLGKGAEKLELKGAVDFKAFQTLLEGCLPHGELMSQVKKGQYHRPGYDLTFSAPKSVSILVLIAGDETILQAHREAVQETMAKIEQKYGSCRIKQNGIIHIEKTENLIAAAFEHSDSRAGDPNLHTHCVLMNMTQDAKDKWRALYGDELYTNNLLNGMEYRSRLASKLMTLGYEIDINDKGLFEIKALDKDLLTAYSKRRTEIEAWLTEHGENSAKAGELANFLTRQAKVSADPEERKQRWIAELEALGSSVDKLKTIIEQAKENGPIALPVPEVIANQAITMAVNHLSERKTAFSFQEVIKAAKFMSLLPANEGDLLQTIEKEITAKNIIYLENKLLTTPELHSLEQKNVALMQTAKGSVHKIMPGWIASLTTAFKTDDALERQALMGLLGNNDRQLLLSANSKILLQKTLKDYAALSQAQGYYPRVITQNKTQVEPLKHQLGTERVNTIEGFLLACETRLEKRGEPKHLLEAWDRRVKNQTAKDIWIVNGGINGRQLNQLGQYADSLGARIIFTQLKEIAAIEPLKKAGITEIKLNGAAHRIESLKVQEQLIHQLENLNQRHAIQSEADDQTRQSLAVKHMVENYSKQPCLVTLNRSETSSLNTLIRDTLKEAKILTGSTQTMPILRPLSMSLEEKRQSHFYQPGDVIYFNRDLPDTPITKGSYCEVHQVDLERKLVELHHDNHQIFWDPAKNKTFLKHVEVYKKEIREVQAGDILRWERSLDDKIKGQTAVVCEVNPGKILAALSNGGKVTLNESSLSHRHWDYGYSAPLKEATLPASKEALLWLQHKRLDPHNLPILNEWLSHAAEEKVSVKILCDDINELKKTVTKSGSPAVPRETTAEASYQRQEVLENYPTLAAEPLFNGLQSEYLKIGGSHSDLLKPSETVPITPELRKACDIVDRISVYHAEREAVLKLEDLKKDVIQLGGLMTSVESLEKAVDLALQQGWLITVGEEDAGAKLVTAKHTLLMEQQCIEKIQAGKNQLVPILPQDSPAVQTMLDHSRLTQGQKEAIQLILTTQDRFVAIQGIAGAGKTTALKEINRLCESNHYTLVLANTASAKNQAQSASGITAKTTAQFLTRMETAVNQDLEQAKKDFGGNRLYILDESSLASSRDLFRLQTLIEKLEARLALVGDFKQIGSIGAGLGYHDFLAYGIQKAVMQENVRLSDPTAFTAMKQAYAGDMKGTLQTIKDSIEEIPDKKEALNRIVTAYFSLSLTHSEAPLIITPLNEDRKYVNEAIRDKLKEQGKIAQAGFKTSVFVSADKRETDKSHASSYHKEDVIRFNTHHPRLNIQAGDYADIIAIDLKHERLTLKIPGKQEFYWSPKNCDKPSSIEIYQRSTREFSKGDTIVFKRNNEKEGIFNGDRAAILQVENHRIQVLLNNGITANIDLKQLHNQHLDHGYALTTYAAQGKDVSFVIAYGEGPAPRLVRASYLKTGDITILPRELQAENEPSKIVQVLKTETAQEDQSLNGKTATLDKIMLTLKDRDDNIYTTHTHETKKWAHFPPFEERKPGELPRVTSQQSFIVAITRGNGLMLVVPYLEDFEKTLEVHDQLNRSALSYQDPKWQERHEAVNRLTSHIRGKAEQKLKPNTLEPASKREETTHDKQTPVKEKRFISLKRKDHFIDKDELEFKLSTHLLGYASQWLGSPSSVTGKEARWGNKGSFSLILSGPRAGMWNNFEADKKGKGLISLYKELHGVSYQEAIQELGKDFGMTSEKSHSSSKKIKPLETDTIKLKQQQKIEEEEKIRIKKALRLYHKAVPIEGTLAEKYLRDHRGIAGELPKDFKFLKSDQHFQTKKYLPALVAPYKNKAGETVGIVRIYLNQDGSQYKDTFIDKRKEAAKAVPKANKGISAHGSVTVQNGVISRTLWIAEGIETALSVAKAVPNQTVVASLSAKQIANVPLPPETQQVVICADNDPASSKTKDSIAKAVTSFLSQGVKVSIALPPVHPIDTKKFDFNDLLKEQGVQAVQKCLESMVNVKETNLLQASEARLYTDLNKIRSEHQAISRSKEIGNFNHKEKTSSIESRSLNQERLLQKEMER